MTTVTQIAAPTADQTAEIEAFIASNFRAPTCAVNLASCNIKPIVTDCESEVLYSAWIEAYVVCPVEFHGTAYPITFQLNDYFEDVLKKGRWIHVFRGKAYDDLCASIVSSVNESFNVNYSSVEQGSHSAFRTALSQYSSYVRKEVMAALKIEVDKFCANPVIVIQPLTQPLNDEQLKRHFYLDSTEIVLQPYVQLDYHSVMICKTREGRYIGAMEKHGDLLMIVEMSYEQYKDACDEATEHNPGDSGRHVAIYNHIRKAAGKSDEDEDYCEDEYEEAA